MAYNNAAIFKVFLISLFSLAGCGGSDNEESDPISVGSSPSPTPTQSPDSGANLPSESIRSELARLNMTGKVVARVETSNQEYEVFYTDGESQKIGEGLVESIIEDSNNWLITIRFEDSMTSELNFVGNSIGLNQTNIELDPNGTTPLSAIARFSTPFPGQIRLVVPAKGESGIAIEKVFIREGDTYEIPVLGLYQDFINAVEFHFMDTAGNILSTDVVNIETEAVASEPNFVILENNLPDDEDKVYMEVGLKHAFDQRGELRWAYTGSDLAQLFDRLPNGNWVSSTAANNVVYHFPEFVEVDMLGNIVETYSVPNLGHHEIRAIDNGQVYLVGSNSVLMGPNGFNDDLGTLQEDTVVEISADTGEIIREYDFNVLLDNTRTPIVNNILDDWYHINSADLDIGPDGISNTDDDGIVVSGRHQSAVAKVNRTSGELDWILAPHELWPENLQNKLLTPVDENGTPIDITDANFWAYGQHSAVVLPNRNILMYDNGTQRGFYKETPRDENLYTRAIEYAIDEENMTIRKVWEFDYMRAIFTVATGEIDYLPDTGNRLISFLWFTTGDLPTPRVVELNSDNEIVFEYLVNEGTRGYRSDKFDLYENIE